jgi:UPF0755 protein
VIDTADVQPPPVRGRGGLKGCLALLVLLGVVAVAGVFVVQAAREGISDYFGGPEDYSGETVGDSVLFEVRDGESTTAIARNLEQQGVVASVDAFTDAAEEDEKAIGIQVGFYQLRERMPAEDALGVLVDPDNLVQNAVTVPEGLRVERTVALLSEKTGIPAAQFEKALDRPRQLGLPAGAGGDAEGYLFPATYRFRPDADATSMLREMVARWRQAADEARLEKRADELGYSVHELMTIASLIEAEANRDADRAKVARVIYNRLETDVTNGLLQIDATVNFALGKDRGLALTQEELAVDSPYNTRRYPGLPPGPIESPGDKAIQAAAHPAKGNWVYYVTVDLETGETKFTADYDTFLAYKQELEEWCAGSDRC